MSSTILPARTARTDVRPWTAFAKLVLQDVFHATVNNWVTVYLEMAQKVQLCPCHRQCPISLSELAGRNSFLEGVQALAGWNRTFRAGKKSPINSEQVSCAVFRYFAFSWNVLGSNARCCCTLQELEGATGPQRDFVSQNSNVTGFESLPPAHQDDNAGPEQIQMCASSLVHKGTGTVFVADHISSSTCYNMQCLQGQNR